MNRLLYRLMYVLSRPAWDTGTTPPRLNEAFEHGNVPSGPVIDLGCGTGTNVIYMAQQGHTAIGIDYVPEAIARARQKAQKAGVADRTQFFVGDVTRLDKLSLPHVGFALDMGCFHGLSREEQRRYVTGLSALMCPGGQVMMYVLVPRREAGIAFGTSSEAVKEAVSPWFQLVRTEQDEFWRNHATWIWMVRARST